MAEPSSTDPVKDDFKFEYGDISIKVKLSSEETIIGKADSNALARASPVWKKFIYPPFPQIESDESAIPVPVKELDFTEDDPTALLVLRVAHLCFKNVPSSPSYELLVKLATLCDQYDCIDLVRPWFHTWFWGEASEATKDGQEKWLFIAWVFGRESALNALALKLVKELSLDEEGKADFKIKDIGSLPVPQSLIENILKIRIVTIGRLLQLPYTCIGRYEMNKAKSCKKSNSRESCDAMSYGCILKSVENADLWPRLKAQDVRTSVSKLASTINGFQNLYLSGHDNCLGIFDMKTSVAGILSGIGSPLLESHHQILKARNQQT
ncbi:hypothetical protein V8E51_015653 [Hyaloscypha variabilis]